MKFATLNKESKDTQDTTDKSHIENENESTKELKSNGSDNQVIDHEDNLPSEDIDTINEEELFDSSSFVDAFEDQSKSLEDRFQEMKDDFSAEHKPLVSEKFDNSFDEPSNVDAHTASSSSISMNNYYPTTEELTSKYDIQQEDIEDTKESREYSETQEATPSSMTSDEIVIDKPTIAQKDIDVKNEEINHSDINHNESTVEPAVEPTVEPTVEPAVEPTVEPTVDLAVEPTVEPVVENNVKEVVASQGDEDNNEMPTIESISINNSSDTAVLNNITLNDVDSVNLEGASVALINYQDGDSLTIDNLPDSITATIVGGSVELSGTATIAEYESALKSLNFETTSSDNSSREFVFSVFDGTTHSEAQSIDFNLPNASISNIPVIDTIIDTTGNTDLSINGTANIGDKITIYNGDDVVGTTDVDKNGNWSFLDSDRVLISDVDNTDAQYFNITATATNAIGDESDFSASKSLITDGFDTSIETIETTKEDDNVFAGDGDDRIVSSVGSDTIDGGAGLDTLTYKASDAAVQVNLETNEVSGGYAEGDSISNIERVDGSDFDDVLVGNNSGFNYLIGNDGDDIIEANGGNNFLHGGSGDDTITGGDGKDNIVGGAGADILDGGAGVDILNYVDSRGAVNVNLETNEVSGGSAEGDSIENFEGALGSQYDDTIAGNDEDNLLYAKDGDDIITGAGGDDYIDAGMGEDTVNYSGNFNDYTIENQANGSLSVSDDRGESFDGVDTLSNTENLQFADGVYSVENSLFTASADINQSDDYNIITLDDGIDMNFSDDNLESLSDVDELNMQNNSANSIEGITLDDILEMTDDNNTLTITGDDQDSLEIDTNGWEENTPAVMDNDTGMTTYEYSNGSGDIITLNIDEQIHSTGM